MATKTVRAKKVRSAFASLMVKEVIEKKVQRAQLDTKGDVLAGLMTKGCGVIRW